MLQIIRQKALAVMYYRNLLRLVLYFINNPFLLLDLPILLNVGEDHPNAFKKQRFLFTALILQVRSLALHTWF